MRKKVIVAVLMVLAASVELSAEQMAPEKITEEKFEELAAKAEKDRWASEDGEFSIYLVRPPEKEYGKPDLFLFKCGRTAPEYYLMLNESGLQADDLQTYDKLDGVHRLRPGVYFAFLSASGNGMKGGDTLSYPVFYLMEGRQLIVHDPVSTSWGSNMSEGFSMELIPKYPDLDGDGIPEIVISRHTEARTCRGPSACCSGEQDGGPDGSCTFVDEQKTEIARIFDYRGRDVTRWFGQACCWGQNWPEEFVLNADDPKGGVAPDWQNPKGWTLFESNRFADREFITTRHPERWGGPADLSFEVKLGTFNAQRLVQITVHDDHPIFDPALRPIYRDHLEIWLRSDDYDEKAERSYINYYQLGFLPPRPGSDQGEVKVWQTRRDKPAGKNKASRPYPVEKVQDQWLKTGDGYQVTLDLPYAGNLAVCVSDNDSEKAPGQETMMCDRQPDEEYRMIAPSCGDDGG